MVDCPECKGNRILVPRGEMKHAVECPHCDGEGKKEDEDGKE